ncbi:hypothetical protein CEXT_176461, partial [Caerostris extrusa]
VNAGDTRGNTPLIYACTRRSIACVKLFLNVGADIEARLNITTEHYGTSLHIAAMAKNLEIAKLLIEYDQSAAQPGVLKDLCRRQIRASLGSNRLKFLPNFNIPRRLRLYLMHRA